MTKRCLHVAQPTSEGLAAAVLDHMDMLRQRDWTVGLACPDDGGMLPELARERGFDFWDWPAVRAPYRGLRAETRRLAEVLRDAAPDLVHLQSSKAGLSGRLLIRGRIPTVFSPHAWSFFPGGAAQRAAAFRWERHAARWTDVYVCCGEAERDEAVRRGLAAPAEVVVNAVNLDLDVVPVEQARAGLPPLAGRMHDPLAVCVGRLTHQKGQDVLLRSWPQVLARVPNAQLVLVGDGDMASKLRGLGVPGTIFVGSVPRNEAMRWMSAADLVVAPSRYEGLSVAVLESLTLGRPVVATRCQGMDEAIGAGAGSVVPQGDSEALAAELVRYLGDLQFARVQSAQALSRFAENWGNKFQTSGDRLEQVYSEVIQARSTGSRRA